MNPRSTLHSNILANHYGSIVFRNRPTNPQDKGAAENVVKIVYTQVKARIRNVPFFSLSGLMRNKGASTFVKSKGCKLKDIPRRTVLYSSEKPLLKPLPDMPFEIQCTRI
ncbi:MAG: hypothetical protein IPN86_04890 [Saprospiraceae bacterium]|nr:hypothetical protein [Saprospiraceae bacterium]